MAGFDRLFSLWPAASCLLRRPKCPDLSPLGYHKSNYTFKASEILGYCSIYIKTHGYSRNNLINTTPCILSCARIVSINSRCEIQLLFLCAFPRILRLFISLSFFYFIGFSLSCCPITLIFPGRNNKMCCICNIRCTTHL